ncbi:MAG: adenine deaminase C-terminal domain-containing protein [Tuberibacillus sp.]
MAFYQPWNRDELRHQTAVAGGKIPPTMVLANAEYLNTSLKRWVKANIWIDGDRIVYVGEKMPESTSETEIVDCSGKVAVPGYIEPHAHPFQLYNPLTFASFAAEHGTTTLISDNLIFYTNLTDEESFSVIEKLNSGPTTHLWWCRYDAQTALRNQPFTKERIQKWLDHPLVVQGGELTSWPQVLHGDDDILEWMMQTKVAGKPIEGHLPGASEKTLTQMALLGVDCDHEAMTGEEAWRRIQLGLSTSLRYSSIRPDLPDILKDLVERGLENFERVYMTTDGATPNFYKQGIMDRTIEIAIVQGVPLIEAYAMATVNPARHYGLQNLVGEIAPGRFAHINILEAKDQPTPMDVLAKGQWVKKNGVPCYPDPSFSLKDVFGEFTVDWELTEDMLEPDSTIGIDMVNAVITKPMMSEEDSQDISILALIDKKGHWKVTTRLKGFANNLGGFASSYSSTGDVIILGRNKQDMIIAFRRMKDIGGGIVLVEDGRVQAEFPLALRGWVSDQPMEILMELETALTKQLRNRGYQFADPIYTLLFLSALHLPYIRITPQGIVDVMKLKVLVPAKDI